MSTHKIKMEPEAREAYRKYQREWRRKNRDKVRQYEANQWNKKAILMTTDQKDTDQAEPLTGPSDK